MDNSDMDRLKSLAVGVAAAAAMAVGFPAAAQISANVSAEVAVEAESEQPTPPDELARETATELLEELKARNAEFKADPAKLDAAVERIVLPHFDMKYVSALVLARNWGPASPEQREAFQEAFTGQLVSFYGNALLDYSDETVTWEPMELEPDARKATVRSNIEQPGGASIPLSYSLHMRQGRWQVYDVTVDGISIVNNFRGQFAAEIRRNGLDALIDRLQAERVTLKS